MKKFYKLIAIAVAAALVAAPSVNLVAATEVTNSVDEEVTGNDGANSSQTGEAAAQGGGYQAGAAAPLVGAQALAAAALAAGIAALALTNNSNASHGHGHSH